MEFHSPSFVSLAHPVIAIPVPYAVAQLLSIRHVPELVAFPRTVATSPVITLPPLPPVTTTTTRLTSTFTPTVVPSAFAIALT
ncbi:hypothetical protein H1R20_g10402, partial [Candolleomyces eurysporus]